MPVEVESHGKIDVSLTAIASIAEEAVLRSYGVVGIAPKDLASSIVGALSQRSRKGIDVRIEDDWITIDVYVIIEYGTRILAVAHSVMSVVKYSVERAVGIPVAEVNVHVEGLRVSNTD